MEQKVTIKIRVDNMQALPVKNAINEALDNTYDWKYTEDEIGYHFQKEANVNEGILNTLQIASSNIIRDLKINHVVELQATQEKHGYIYNRRITH